MSLTAAYWIDKLGLIPHPEGGFYKQTFRSELTQDGRSASTAIYFLLTPAGFSAFHRLSSDELWHFYAGSPVNVHVIDPDGTYSLHSLGPDAESGQHFQTAVPAGCWFASEVREGAAFGLVGCTVAPGFEFSDFELADRERLAAAYPKHRLLIERLTRTSSQSA